MLLLALWLLWSGPGLPPPPPVEGRIDHILVDKSARAMVLYKDGWPVRLYPVALGRDPDGPKAVQGDGRTPEGLFRIDRRNAGSAFHLSLGIDYPQDRHRVAARALGRSPGGDIFIHGQPNAVPDGYRMRGDWTDGCIALTNSRVEELWRLAGIGTTVEIRP
jgi:murein L,D-transpeptidase YafK